MTDYRARPELWQQVEKFANKPDDYCTLFLELRARLEALEKKTAPALAPSEEWLKARENQICTHSAWAEDGVLKMANNDDSHYVETFTSRQELEQFIAYLRFQANEAWPL